MTCREVSIDIVQPKSSCNMQPSGGASGRVSIPLRSKVESLTRIQPENSIFKVHSHLRELNKKAYEPEIIAIGPYHHGNENLSMMEEHKVRYLHNLLQRKNESVDRYIEAIRQHEEKVRNFYAEPLSSLTSDDLVEMMVLDGCFIIELLRKNSRPHLRDANDPKFKMNWMMNSLQRDLMLFENQLPFMVLHELFGMVEAPNDKRFIQLLLKFFIHILPDPEHRWRKPPEDSLDEVKHLLDFIHINCLPRDPPDDDVTENIGDTIFIRCASELREAGVKFEKIQGDSLFDISFTKGTLKMPTFMMEDRTETLLRNLIAHEQYNETSRPMFVTGYARFMDRLIDTSEDVEILSRHGIIDNWLDDGEDVSDMFNKITHSVTRQSNYFRYTDVLKGLDSHCNSLNSQIIRRKSRWMNILRNDYFNSPWSIISFVAAAVLLILTVIQTTFTLFRGN